MNGINYDTPYPYLYNEFMGYSKNNKKQMNSIYGYHPTGWGPDDYMTMMNKKGEDIMNDNIQVITICGSMKFADEMKKQETRLTKDGYIVLMPIIRDVEREGIITEEEEQIYRNAHFQKIKMSDAILVINKDGYIGRHTCSQIEAASQTKRQIYFLENANNKDV